MIAFEAHQAALQDIPEFEDFSIEQEAMTAREVTAEFVDSSLGSTDQVEFELRGRVGDVAKETLSEVDRLDPRFLFVGGRRRSPVGKAVFGSIAQHRLLNADCPVVSARSDEQRATLAVIGEGRR